MGPPIDHKGIILAPQNDPNLGVSSILYLHAGLEIGFLFPHANDREFN